MNILRRLLRLSVVSLLAALVGTGCSKSSSDPDLAHREFAWALSHGGCECGPAAFPTGNAGAAGEYAREVDDYVQRFSSECRRKQVFVVAYGDGVADLASDMKLARARALALTDRLSLEHRFDLDAVWFGGPGVWHASTAQAMCLTERVPPQFRASAT